MIERFVEHLLRRVLLPAATAAYGKGELLDPIARDLHGVALGFFPEIQIVVARKHERRAIGGPVSDIRRRTATSGGRATATTARASTPDANGCIDFFILGHQRVLGTAE